MRTAKEFGTDKLMEHLRYHFLYFCEPIPFSGCWLWTGSLDRKGYGKFYVGVCPTRARRTALVLLSGISIPDGMVVHHKCNVRSCVNPDHLEITTSYNNSHSVNSSAVPRINAAKTHCPKGHPYDDLNTYLKYKKGGHRPERNCKRCRAESARRARARGKIPVL